MRARSNRWFIVLVAAFSALVACRREAPPVPSRPPAVPIERPAILAPRPIAASASFDLAPASGGAFLAWGPPSTSGGGVHGILLDRFGSAGGRDAPIHAPAPTPGVAAGAGSQPDAIELVVASGGGRVGVVWVEHEQAELTLRGSVGDPRAGSFSPVRTFGETARSTIGSRGYVALDGSASGAFVALVRGLDAPCANAPGRTCGTFSLATLTPDAMKARGVPLSVPDPCARAVVGVVSGQGRFHYAVCGDVEGRPLTTVYSIQDAPSYARADAALPGCAPDGLLTAGEDVVVPGACAGGRTAVRLSPGANALRPISVDRITVSCRGATPVIDTGTDGLRIALEAPLARVEAILPASVAPPRSRAVWTGASLLVAQPISGEVVLHRYQCEDGQLRRTDVL